MKTVVIYKSRTGYTQKYAEWIAEDLGADLYPLKEIKVKDALDYDVIIYGGGVHAYGIDGVKFITKNFKKFAKQKIIVFATGISIPSKKVVEDVATANFKKEEQLKSIPFFYFRGGYDQAKLGRFDRWLMGILEKLLTRKKTKGKELSEEEAGLLDLISQSGDFCDKNNIEVLLNEVK